MGPNTIILFGIIIFALVLLFNSIRIIPQRMAYIVERLGKYSSTLEAGFHIVVPFLDKGVI